MTTTPAEADRLFEAAKKGIAARVVEIQKAVALSAFQMIATDSRTVSLDYGSPVLTGRYRGSHRISIGSIDASVAAPVDKDEEGAIPAPPLSQAARILAGLKPFDIVYISNALPYSRRIEFGWSKLKAPDGVYRVTAHAVVDKFKNANAKGILGG